MEKRTEKTEDFIDLNEKFLDVMPTKESVSQNIKNLCMKKMTFVTKDGYQIIIPNNRYKQHHLLTGHQRKNDHKQKRKRRAKYILSLEEIIRNSTLERVSPNKKIEKKSNIKNYVCFTSNVKIHEKIYTLRIVTEEYTNKKHATPGIVMKDSENPPYGILDLKQRSDSVQRACGYTNTFPEKKSSVFYIYDIYETKIHVIRDKNPVITPVPEKNSDTAVTPENFTVYFQNLLDTGKYGKNPIKIAAVCLKMAEESGGKENKERIAEWLKKQGCTSEESTKKFFEELAKQDISKRTDNKHQDYKNPGKEKNKNNEYNMEC